MLDVEITARGAVLKPLQNTTTQNNASKTLFGRVNLGVPANVSRLLEHDMYKQMKALLLVLRLGYGWRFGGRVDEEKTRSWLEPPVTIRC